MNTLKDLAELAGISSSYVDKTGKTQVTNDEVRKFFLKAMNIKAESQQEIDDSVKELSKVDVLSKVLTFFDDETIKFNIKKEGKFEIVLTDEEGNEVWSGKCDGFEDVIIQNLPTGYFDIKVKGGDEVYDSMLIHAPKMCYLPDFIKNREHLYGVSLMLYAL
jgi:4-alpha-glucanotransferase